MEPLACRQQRKMTSTDLRRTINAPHKQTSIYCSKKSRLQKFTTPKARKGSSTEWFISSVILRDEEMFAHMCVRVWKRRENEVMRAPNSQ